MCSALKPDSGVGRKQAFQDAVPGFRQLIQDKRCASQLGMDGEKSRPCRGFKDKIGRNKLSRARHGFADADRRRELLQADAVLRALGVRGQQLLDPLQKAGKFRRVTTGLCKKRPAVAPEKQNAGRFRGLIGIFPAPGAVGVGAARDLLHGCAQQPCVERFAFRERGEKDGRGIEDDARFTGFRGSIEGFGGRGVRGRHVGIFQVRGWE